MPRDEAEAAYFALLRAREEVAALHRYEEYLRAESQRLRRTTSEGDALAAQVDRRLLRPIRHTDAPLADATRQRLATVAEERERVPERLAAAEAYVAQCEHELAELRRR
jgi:DNA anti-recombination protein RmuC